MWLLEHDAYESMQAAIASGSAPNAEQQAQYEATYISALTEGGSRILTVAGSSAEIAIKGVLTKSPSFLAMLFGGGNTTYSDIISALNEADANPEVGDIVLAIDSPGGSVDGLFDAVDTIKTIRKPIKAVGRNLVASAAYALASQADTIISSNDATRFGSIGVLASFMVYSDEVNITSTMAPKKAPDVTTPEGVAMVREELDAIHDLFVGAIADGRGGTADDINANFGQGGVLLAGEALKRGMIDSITVRPIQSIKNATTQTAASGGDKPKVKVMDLAELQAKHPEAYSAAVNVGVTQERDRVGAHLKMGESSGDMKTAINACLDGIGMTDTLTATYLSARMNRNDVNAATSDEATTAAAADNANAESDTAVSDAEKVAAGLEARFGTETK